METLTTKFFSFLFLTMFGGGWTVPLGVPPAKEEPVLARVAPEKCLFYASWAGIAPADPKSKNQTEQLLAEPEVQRSITVLSTFLYQTVLPELASGNFIGNYSGDPTRRAQEAIYSPENQHAAQGEPEQIVNERDVATLWRLASDFAAIAAKHPGAIYFESASPLLQLSCVGETKADKQNTHQDVRGGMIVVAGADADKLHKLFEQFVKQFKATQPKQVRQVQIAGKTWYLFAGSKGRKDQPPIVCGFHGTNLILGVGEGSVEGIVARSGREPPAWLVGLRKQLPIERVSTVVFLNTKMLLEQITAAPMPRTLEAARKLGLDNVTAVSAISGLDNETFASKLLISTEGEVRGILRAFSDQSLREEDLQPIPRDSTLSLAMRFDCRAIIGLLAAGDSEPADASAVDRFFSAVAKAMQPDFRRELPKALGDKWCIYSSPGEGGLVTAVIGVKDHKAASAIQLKLVTGTLATGFADALMQDTGFSNRSAVRIAAVDFAGQRIFACVPAPLPAWCLTERELIIAPTAQNIMAYLKRPRGEKSLAAVPQVGRLLGGRDGPSLVAHIDTLRVFELIYPMIPLYVQSGLNELDRPGYVLPLDAFPSFPALRRHLLPGTAALRRTKRGLELTSRQPMPGTGLLWTLALVATNSGSLEQHIADEKRLQNAPPFDRGAVFEPADTPPYGTLTAPQPSTGPAAAAPSATR